MQQLVLWCWLLASQITWHDHYTEKHCLKVETPLQLLISPVYLRHRSCQHVFGPVGHTHNQQDQRISVVFTALASAPTLQHPQDWGCSWACRACEWQISVFYKLPDRNWTYSIVLHVWFDRILSPVVLIEVIPNSWQITEGVPGLRRMHRGTCKACQGSRTDGASHWSGFGSCFVHSFSGAFFNVISSSKTQTT